MKQTTSILRPAGILALTAAILAVPSVSKADSSVTVTNLPEIELSGYLKSGELDLGQVGDGDGAVGFGDGGDGEDRSGECENAGRTEDAGGLFHNLPFHFFALLITTAD